MRHDILRLAARRRGERKGGETGDERETVVFVVTASRSVVSEKREQCSPGSIPPCLRTQRRTCSISAASPGKQPQKRRAFCLHTR